MLKLFKGVNSSRFDVKLQFANHLGLRLKGYLQLFLLGTGTDRLLLLVSRVGHLHLSELDSGDGDSIRAALNSLGEDHQLDL